MPKKNIVKYIKPIFDDGSVDVGLQFEVKKSVENSKIVKPKDVFEGYKAKKKTKINK
tara:strand:- start:63 stop:233 length:171 start_codon:yes stop_codon:yes gene_type:complete